MAAMPPPPPTKSEPGSFAWFDWYRSLYDFLTGTSTVSWATIDKAGSNLADLTTRLHSSLQSVLGTGQYHISAAEGTTVTGLASGTINSLHVNGTGSLGYAAGAGGSVTQLTNKSTTVTLNKPCGQITMNNAALGAGATVFFTFNNSFISTDDNVLLTLNGATSLVNYSYRVSVSGGACIILIKNESAGSLSDAVVLNYSVIKSAIT